MAQRRPCKPQAVMADPVLAADGHTYERAAIAAYLEAHAGMSPVAGAHIGRELIPNFALRNTIVAMRAQG